MRKKSAIGEYCRRVRWAKRAVIGVGVLVLVVLVAAFGYLKVQSDRAVALPAPSGPDRVGRVVYDWVDQSRMDPFAPKWIHAARAVSVDLVPGGACSRRSHRFLLAGGLAESAR
jgi:hypothetical protein